MVAQIAGDDNPFARLPFKPALKLVRPVGSLTGQLPSVHAYIVARLILQHNVGGRFCLNQWNLQGRPQAEREIPEIFIVRLEESIRVLGT